MEGFYKRYIFAECYVPINCHRKHKSDRNVNLRIYSFIIHILTLEKTGLVPSRFSLLFLEQHMVLEEK